MPVPHINIRESDLKDPACSNLNMIARTHADELNRLGGLNGPVAILSPVKIAGSITGKSVVVGTAQILSGSGSPEGVVSAPMGSLYLNTLGGANNTMWVKEVGSGSTGWTAK
jgi:hypothetical protein